MKKTLYALALATIFSTQLPTLEARAAPARVKTGLTAKGLIRLLSNSSVTRALENHSVDSLEIENVDNGETRGFVILLETTALGPTAKGPAPRPCLVSILASKPAQSAKSTYSVTTRELCIAPGGRTSPSEDDAPTPTIEMKATEMKAI